LPTPQFEIPVEKFDYLVHYYYTTFCKDKFFFSSQKLETKVIGTRRGEGFVVIQPYEEVYMKA
jgi:hypothetical protein